MRRALPAFMALACVAAEAHAFNRALTERGAPLHWVEECVYFTLAAPGSDDVDDLEALTEAVRRGFEVWNVDCSAMRFVYGGDSDCLEAGFTPGRPHANLVIWLEDEWPYDVDLGDALAATSVYYNPDTGEILDADVEFNGVDFEWTTEGLPGRRDVWNTMAHEAGHVLGLDHVDIEEATMYVFSVPGDTQKRDLDPDDVDGVCTIYAPGTDLEPCPPPPGDGALCRGGSSGCSCAVPGGAGAAPARLALLVLIAVTAIAVASRRRRPGARRTRRRGARSAGVGAGSDCKAIRRTAGPRRHARPVPEERPAPRPRRQARQNDVLAADDGGTASSRGGAVSRHE
ncbi:MAG: matrixin family metalloprotease [Deltaproteobacteria bacterium]|nr:matrixin family metalloprotease [Deltaproteobacteria bacterium]